VRREDAVAQDVLLCINTGKFRTDTNRMRMEGDQFFLRSRRRCKRRSRDWRTQFPAASRLRTESTCN
jgi:DNA polymerase III alpha subunit